MPASTGVYAMMVLWLNALGYPQHLTARRALAHQVAAVLVGQSLRPASRMRAMLSAWSTSARQRFRRTARGLVRKSLSPQWLTAVLIRAVLALRSDPDARVLLALDGVRCGRWEIIVVGVVWGSRVLPVGWGVLPYPWPKRRYTPLTCQVVREVAAAFPGDVEVHLVADRGFPSRKLFRRLQDLGWGWTLRVSASRTVTTASYEGLVRGLLQSSPEGSWASYPDSYATGKGAVPGLLVVGKVAPVIPPHQRGPASLEVRRQQRNRREAHVRTKNRTLGPVWATETDQWVVLFTTLATAQEARRIYQQRWAIESSFRDAKGGWDGQHGWDLEPAVARQTSAEAVAGLAGLWALSNLVQTWVGTQVAHGPRPVQLTSHHWTTTQRLNAWARGHLVFSARSDTFTPWLQMTMNRGAACLASTSSPTLLGRPLALRRVA